MTASAAAQTSILLIPPFGGAQFVNPLAVSADGNSIVGYGGTGLLCHQRAFVWTAAQGTSVLPLLGGDPCNGEAPRATAISRDGQYAAGMAPINLYNIHHAVRWTLAGIPSIEDLGVVAGPPNSTRSDATGLSFSGSVVVGQSGGCGNARPFRWSNGSMSALTSCSDPLMSDARACNADATVAVGRIILSNDQAARWVVGSPVELLGFLPGTNQSMATAVDGSGTVVVGRSAIAGPGGLRTRAFRWEPQTGMVALPLLPDSTDSEAYAISDDGSIMGGRVFGGIARTVVWTADGRVIDVSCILQEAGVSLVGFGPRLSDGITGLSADGRVMVGFSRNGFRIQVDNFDAAASISSHPEHAAACQSESQSFSVDASGSGVLSYQWRRDGVPINASENASATTMTLSLSNIQASDAASYDCVVTNSCGVATSRAATLTICACLGCPADFNLDGGVDGSDVNEFFAAWETGSCDADVNADGGVDGADVEVFFPAWEAGGCE